MGLKIMGPFVSQEENRFWLGICSAVYRTISNTNCRVLFPPTESKSCWDLLLLSFQNNSKVLTEVKMSCSVPGAAAEHGGSEQSQGLVCLGTWFTPLAALRSWANCFTSPPLGLFSCMWNKNNRSNYHTRSWRLNELQFIKFVGQSLAQGKHSLSAG